MQGIDRWRHDEAYVPPPPHRGAPADELREAGTVPRREPLDVRLGWERMDGEGGGSAPMHDAPEDGDLRFLHRRLQQIAEDEERFGHWP